MDIPETRFARTGEGSIAYQVVGGGAIKVIVSNTMFPIDLMWDEPHLVAFLDRLSSFCCHVWFDGYGTGASDWVVPSERRVLESNVNAMVAVLDDLGWDSAAVLGLHTHEGLLFAMTHPERVRALALVNTFGRIRRADNYPEGLANDEVDRRIGAIERDPSLFLWHAFLARSMADDERFVRWLGRALRLVWKPADVPWVASRNFNVDLRSVLSMVRVPTLVVNRAGLPSYLRGRYVADGIEGARHVEVPGDDFLFFAGDTGPMLDAIEEFLTGRLPKPDTDRILATVVFTDIVASTARAAELGDRRWREVLGQHDTLVRYELERFRGREVNTTGDGFVATFDGPARAVACASAIRDRARQLDLAVRAGVHTGEIELRGDDIAGIAVHIAGRIAALAEANEILVSRTVVDLTVGSGLQFEPRGEHELKGVPGTWPTFAAHAPA